MHKLYIKPAKTFEFTFQKIFKKFDNLMEFKEKVTFRGNKKISEKFLVNFV